MEKSLAQKNILITGGTSRLGEEFVRQALRHGANLFFSYHENERKAEELVREGAKGLRLDLSDTRAIDRFVHAFASQAQSLDALIHNAAAVRDHTLQNLTEEDWDFVLAVDLKAPFYLTQKLMPFLAQKKPSKIFYLISRLAVTGGIGVSNYAAAKGGLIGLTKSLAQELGEKGVLVNAVNPGFMKSRMTENMPAIAIQRNLEASPLGKESNPEEVADFLVYLCSDRMSQATGQVFHFESRKM